MEAVPLRKIGLPVTFSDEGNFHNETLTIEVVSFLGTYHAILRRPAYAKFMAVPNYTYLKLKMLGPKGFIVVWTSLGPLPRRVPGPTTRWAPGTTRLALHGT
jgi:hypothetical protein